MISNFDPIVSVASVFSGQYLLHLTCHKDAWQKLVSKIIRVSLDILLSSFVPRLSLYCMIMLQYLWVEKGEPGDEAIGLVHWYHGE